jgi:hypothetical protein
MLATKLRNPSGAPAPGALGLANEEGNAKPGNAPEFARLGVAATAGTLTGGAEGGQEPPTNGTLSGLDGGVRGGAVGDRVVGGWGNGVSAAGSEPACGASL